MWRAASHRIGVSRPLGYAWVEWGMVPKQVGGAE